MDSHQLQRFAAFVVFFWTANELLAQQMDHQQVGSVHNTVGSTYFFYQHPEYPRDCQEVQDQCSSSNSSGVYLIKPDGYPEPFEVYCDNRKDSGGWTVFHRRHNGDVYFGRNWTDYKLGFGFLSNEFWLGNHKLSYLTNQKKYELQIEMTNSGGTSFFVNYNKFRISDEFSDYNLTSLGEYSGNAGMYTTWCQTNTGYGNCTCQRTCEDPHGCLNTCSELETCICLEDYYLKDSICVPPEECDCYVFQTLLPEGGSRANSDCTRKATCNNGQLSLDDSYRCSSNAVCEERDNVRKC
ncbi:Fibrinogen-like protein A [Holothuria leucospilota]|uniref:Fibrinogen-like protein A n=1 Tax=Holothuria leucospilota TaxID=206669 RepID=A0A9Q1BUL0_HOLLE|nr:Fibrinogen-like protein A [Holothuria leucospilota]